MSLLSRFIERAAAAGAEVEVLPSENPISGLSALVKRLGVASAVVAECPDQRLCEALEDALLESGCRILPPERAAQAALGITFPHALVADTGSQVVHSGQGDAMLASLLPPIHLAIADPGTLFADLGEFLESLGDSLPSRLVLVTGPSRTGDIEATMSTGVHGPGRVIIGILPPNWAQLEA